MTEMIEMFSGEYGKHIMIGFMVGAPAGYAFATRTALAVAKDQIKKLEKEKTEYLSRLLKD